MELRQDGKEIEENEGKRVERRSEMAAALFAVRNCWLATYMALMHQSMVYFIRCRPRPGTGRGVPTVITTFILSVLAGVVANYISKWFDERGDGDEPRR